MDRLLSRDTSIAMGQFLVAMIAGVLNAPLHIYQICAWDVGTIKTEPWRSKARTMLDRMHARFWPGLRHAAILAACLGLALCLSAGSVLAAPSGTLWDGNGSDTQAEDGLLKDVYEKVIAEGVQNKFQLRDAFKLKSSPWDGGRGLKWNAHIGRNTSPMATGEDGAFAIADHQKSTVGYITQRKVMARWRTTEEALDDSRTSEAAYRSVYTDNMNRLVDDIAYRDEFYLGTDGRGIFCVINEGTPSNSATVHVKNPGNIAGADFGNRFIQKGMYLAALNPATGTIRAGVQKVVDVDQAGTYLILDAAPNAAWANNDYLVQAANASVTDVLDTAYEKAPWGLTALIDDGTYRGNYFGVDRTKFSVYASYVSAATGALSFDLLQRISDIVSQKLSGEIDAIWCHHSIRRLFILLTQADRRYSDARSLMNPDGGTQAMRQKDLTMGEVDIKAIRTIALAQMYLVDTKGSDFVEYFSEKGKWVDRDGSILRRDGSGATARHAYEAWWYRRHQRFARNPGKSARVDGITGQTLVVVRGE